MLINILLVAVALDLKSCKINNHFIIIGLAAGCNWQMIRFGLEGIIHVILAIGITMLCLYPVYLIKGLGAGDVKLFCVIGCFLTSKELVSAIFISLLIAAVFGVVIMIINKKWTTLLIDIQEGRKPTLTKINFSVPILVSILLQIGGVY